MRRTEVLPMSSRREISDLLIPWRNSFRTSAALTAAVAGLPRRVPLCRAWSNPARTRSRRMSCSKAANLAYYHPHGTRRDAPLLDELGAAIDHIQAFSTGGACSQENFRTACWKCNVRKSDAPLTTWEQRGKRSPVKGKYGEPKDWDGLAALFILLAERDRSRLTASERDWLRALRTVCSAVR